MICARSVMPSVSRTYICFQYRKKFVKKSLRKFELGVVTLFSIDRFWSEVHFALHRLESFSSMLHENGTFYYLSLFTQTASSTHACAYLQASKAEAVCFPSLHIVGTANSLSNYVAPRSVLSRSTSENGIRRHHLFHVHSYMKV